MSTLDALLHSEWQKKINSSPEVKQAKLHLEFHKRKIRQLQEELTSAEVWETELEERLKNVQEKEKPFLMKFCAQLENKDIIDETVIEKTMDENDWEKVVAVLRKRVMKVEEMERRQLVGLVKTVLSVRNCLLEKDCQGRVEVVHELPETS